MQGLRQPQFVSPQEGGQRPPGSICEVIAIAPQHEIPYVFDLAAGEGLEFHLHSTDPVDVIVCRLEAYESWIDSGYDPECAPGVFIQEEQMSAGAIRFTPAVADEYAVVVMNWSDRLVDVAVYVPDSAGA